MTGIELASWSFPVLLALIFIRVPIGLAMAVCGLVGAYFIYGSHAPILNQLKQVTYSTFSNLTGQPTAGIAIYQLPTANALNVATAVRAEMQQLKKSFPEGLDYVILFDTTTFVHDAIDGVIHTLFEAGVLVFLTIFLFLQDWRGTLIPTITIPVSLIGTFALMSAFGITINLISLFGLVLAIAIVVDDAIIVVENVWRIMEQEGVGPKEAAIKAMEELGGAIAGVTLTLMSVFIPASFLPGITGQIYQQFALVLASSTALSAFSTPDSAAGAGSSASAPPASLSGATGAAAGGGGGDAGGGAGRLGSA